MKKVILFLSLFLNAMFVYSQGLPAPDPNTKKVTYTDVIELNGVSRSDIYTRVKQLGVDGSNVVKDDTIAGIYSYKATMAVSYPAPQVGLEHKGEVTYLITIAYKEGKVKYLITDFVHSGSKGSGGELERSIPACNKYTLTMKGWGTIKQKTAENMNNFIPKLKKRIKGADSTVPDMGTDW